MSQAGANSSGGGGGSGITTINGDSGSITGATVTIFCDQNPYGGAPIMGTPKFINSGAISTLQLWDNDINMVAGFQSWSVSHTSGAYNVGFGDANLTSITSGNYNFGFGSNCLNNVSTGSYNLGLGFNAGNNLATSDSSNICIGNVGTVGDNNKIKIGTQGSGSGQQNYCQIAGIVGNTVANQQFVTINSSTGQLGVTTSLNNAWTDVTGATQTLTVQNGYITDRSGGVTYTLPANAALGDVIEVVGKLGLATITPNANQQILMGSVSGTVGVTGTLVSTNVGDCVVLRCITSGTSTVWRSQNHEGTWTLN